jgi:hypothetical protein
MLVGAHPQHLVEDGPSHGTEAVATHLFLADAHATLAPGIIAAILDDTLPAQVTLFDLASGAPLLWEEQRDLIRQYGAGALTPGD